MDPYRSQYLHQFEEDMDWYNGVVLGMLMPGGAWKRLPRLLQSWLRNYIGGIAMYFISGFLWCFYIYWWKHNVYVPKEHIPKKRTMLLHIAASMQALPWYCALPAVSEYVVEKGWTRCFCTISEVGWQFYIASLAAYLILVEIGIYWSHRLLHDIKPLYKYLHAPHHKFNTPKTMSPFAGMALNPLDGILQAAPLVMAIFLVPVHFRTHVGLLFFEGVWSANIHDCIHGTVWPFMGAGYHTIHHTANRHNYGNYTVWMDWMFGTLRHPKEDDKAK